MAMAAVIVAMLFLLLLILEPIGMLPLDPVTMVFVPPVAIVPDASLVKITVFGAPIRMILGPFGIVPIHPGAIVFMPPVGIAPFMVTIVVTPSACAARAHVRSARDFLPDVGMVLQELPKFG